MKKYITLLLLLPVVLLTGCVASSFTDAVKAAGTANKHIKAEFSGWNAHMSYESWPAGVSSNGNGVIITPTTTLQSQQVR